MTRNGQTDKRNPEVTELLYRKPVAHSFPHTHAQTNHGAPAVHRDQV
jgi:hypothetical protein